MYFYLYYVSVVYFSSNIYECILYYYSYSLFFIKNKQSIQIESSFLPKYQHSKVIKLLIFPRLKRNVKLDFAPCLKVRENQER